MAKARLDTIVLARGLAPSRERARALILAGKVEVGGMIVTKAGSRVAPDAQVRLREPDHPYVSRGALKLVAGLDGFGINPAGMVALDVGASTGGFTDVLLRRGAARVYAVDVGYGQLAWSLRTDDRVVVLERENIRHLNPAKVHEACDLAVIDVSFISLTLVLDKVAALMGPPAGKPIVALVKPQFEVGRGKVGKGGVVREPAARRAAVDGVLAWARERGFAVEPVAGREAGPEDDADGDDGAEGDDGHDAAVEPPIRGPAGNVEYLIALRTPPS